MKKLYAAPQLLKHGSVSDITAYTFDSMDFDILFGVTDAQNQPGQGSLNACIQKDGKCINPNASGPGIKN
jgi:hypothetical protein